MIEFRTSDRIGNLRGRIDVISKCDFLLPWERFSSFVKLADGNDFRHSEFRPRSN